MNRRTLLLRTLGFSSTSQLVSSVFAICAPRNSYKQKTTDSKKSLSQPQKRGIGNYLPSIVFSDINGKVWICRWGRKHVNPVLFIVVTGDVPNILETIRVYEQRLTRKGVSIFVLSRSENANITNRTAMWDKGQVATDSWQSGDEGFLKVQLGYSGSTLEQLGVNQATNISFILVDVYGQILDRWNGTGSHTRVFEVEESLFILHNGQKYKCINCAVCNGTSKITKDCDRCAGRGKVSCVNCANGYQVDAFGRTKQCSSCRGTAHVTCEKCRDNSTNFLLQGPNPKGLGKVTAQCGACRDGIATIRMD